MALRAFGTTFVYLAASDKDVARPDFRPAATPLSSAPLPRGTAAFSVFNKRKPSTSEAQMTTISSSRSTLSRRGLLKAGAGALSLVAAGRILSPSGVHAAGGAPE